MERQERLKATIKKETPKKTSSTINLRSQKETRAKHLLKQTLQISLKKKTMMPTIRISAF